MVTVVCTGGEEPPSSQSLAWLNASQRVIAADGGLQWLRALGRKADLWIGDGDSLSGPLENWADSFHTAVVLPRDKDETDTEAAVRTAVAMGTAEIWLMGGSGGRMDHWWANLRLVAGQPAIKRWLTGHEEAWNVGPGECQNLPGGVISIFPLGQGPWSVSSRGLRWPLTGLDFSTCHSLSNEALPEALIQVDQGRVLVMRPIEQGPSV